MRITRKTNVLVKTVRKYIVQQQSSEELIGCGHCDEQMMSAQATADFFQISSREIYRFIESEKIHFVETNANEIYVCPVSVRHILELIK
jgi:hypothetical protein